MKHIKCILILWFALSNLFAQTNTENYVLTKTYTDKDNSTGITQIQYYDGLGRPIETVMKAYTPSGKDLVSTIVYDGAGREWQQWLPAPSANSDGSFVDVESFKNTQKSFYNNDLKPYAQTNYEASPLNRVTGVLGAGELWHNAQKKDSIIYSTNTSTEVRYFFVNNANQLEMSGFYGASTLYKTTTMDADGVTSTEYKDKLGRVVMKRNGSDVNTAFVYNDLNQLCYVVPPKAYDLLTTNGIISDNHDALKKFGYLYKYDNRGNCIAKRLPGCAPTRMIYDKANRLVLSQDGNQRKHNPEKWTSTYYDSFGRIVITSEISEVISELDQNEIETQISVYDFNEHSTYQNGYFSRTSANSKFLIINYYDDYRFLQKENHTTMTNLTDIQKDSFDIKHPSAKGLLTGTRTYLLDGSGQYTVTAMYYDYRGQVVQTRSTNHLGGYDYTYNKYNFSGQPRETLKEHSIASQSMIKERYFYEYDHAGRLKETRYQINNKPTVKINNMTEMGSYDEVGRLKKKRRHSVNNGAFTDSEEFDYNIRNQPTLIKSGTFEQKLYYNINLPNNGSARYNGNIAYSTWTYNGATKGYLYYYDNLNRLSSANHTLNGNIQNGYHENFVYDKMGNILYLERNGDNGTIDYLNYTYNGNQVTQIMDDYTSQSSYSIKEYHDKAYMTPNEIEYDENGNMKKDLDRDIVTIKYNLLNLPEIIQFKNGNQIRNKYNAAGQKLSSRNITVEAGVYQPLNPGDIILNIDVNENDNVTVEGMDYIDNFEYQIYRFFDWDVTFEPVEYKYLSKIHNPEGYATSATTSNGPIYYYYRRDHLGNNREVWRASYTWGSTTHAAATVQRTQYYPSGLPWKYNSGDNPGSQPYKYNGKEFVEMHGLDEYYYIFRNYQPSTMRFTTSDPLAELTPGISPYAFCFNNPMRYIDPLGLTGQQANQKDIYGRNKFDDFGYYLSPMERPGGANATGYGDMNKGYFKQTFAGFYASNSWSVTAGGITTHHYEDIDAAYFTEWIWYSQEEKMYGMPRNLDKRKYTGAVPDIVTFFSANSSIYSNFSKHLNPMSNNKKFPKHGTLFGVAGTIGDAASTFGALNNLIIDPKSFESYSDMFVAAAGWFPIAGDLNAIKYMCAKDQVTKIQNNIISNINPLRGIYCPSLGHVIIW
jgi:RHS repeat-associated protein